MRLFSLVALKRTHSRWLLRCHGLQSYDIQLDNGCTIHVWAPNSSASRPNRKTNHNNTANNIEQANSASPCASLAPSVDCDTKLHNSAESLQSGNVKQFDLHPLKPALVLLHGFGPDGTLAWDNQVAEFSKHFSLYMPDLLFFGNSTISDKLMSSLNANTQHMRSTVVDKEVRYSEIFQAECMHEAMQKMGVREAVVVGHSYGGFVAYQMAHLYPGFVKDVVILSSGIMMNPHSNDTLLSKLGATHIHELLVPPTLPFFIKSIQLVFNDFFPTWLPSFLYKDIYESLAGDREGRLRLVDDIILGKEGAPPLPTIKQNTLIVWGEEDQIFDITLAHQLKEFLGAKATLSTIKGVGHVPHMVKPKEFNGLLLSYLMAKQ